MSLYVLDTDIVTLHSTGHPTVMQNVLRHPPMDVTIAVLTVEEQLAGWFTQLRRAKTRDQLARAYAALAKTVTTVGRFPILSYTEAGIKRYEGLAAMKLGVRGMDLRIAAVALENSATVVTRNLRDFRRIPGLTIEDWSA